MYLLNKKKQHNQTDSTTCQIPKYHLISDIIKFQGVGVKARYAILNNFRVTRTID
jgi:hypothetical protein